MSYNCAKCSREADGSTIVEGGIGYNFCKTCTDILNELDRTGNVIHDFLGPKEESWVAKNMRLAKEKREKGEGPWTKRN